MGFRDKPCRECGKVFSPRHRTALFCCVAHKQAFNNRRRERGAELYDFVMAEGWRSPIGARLIEAYKKADAIKRNGRPSFQDMETAIQRIPIVFGNSGDGR